MSLKRKMAEGIGRLLGLYVAPKREVWNIVQREFLQQFLTSFHIDCIFDVGANDGQYAMLVRAIGFEGPIISFEPIPRVAASLRKRAASDPKWFVEEIALDEVERVTDFKIMRANQVSSILDADRSCRHLPAYQVVETLKVTTGVVANYFDSYRHKLKFRRPFLKTDAQGADLAVIKGAGSRLHDLVGLQTELSFARMYDGQDDYRTAIDFLEQNGFELSALFPLGTPLFPRLAEMDCVMFNSRFLETGPLIGEPNQGGQRHIVPPTESCAQVNDSEAKCRQAQVRSGFSCGAREPARQPPANILPCAANVLYG